MSRIISEFVPVPEHLHYELSAPCVTLPLVYLGSRNNSSSTLLSCNNSSPSHSVLLATADVLKMGPRKSSPHSDLPEGHRRRHLHNHAKLSIRRKDNKLNGSSVGVIGKSTENARRIFAWCCGKYVLISLVCHSNYLINYLFTTITTEAPFSMVPIESGSARIKGCDAGWWMAVLLMLAKKKKKFSSNNKSLVNNGNHSTSCVSPVVFSANKQRFERTPCKW